MTLGFSTEIAGKPCFFPEKIEACLGEENGFQPKPHTIRKGERWRRGLTIHMVTGNRTKNRTLFRKAYCSGIQKIEAFWRGYTFYLSVDNYVLTPPQLEILAQNDGFENAGELEKFFEKNMRRYETFTGQLVHWTNGRYFEGDWTCKITEHSPELAKLGLGRDARNSAVQAFFQLKNCLNND